MLDPVAGHHLLGEMPYEDRQKYYTSIEPAQDIELRALFTDKQKRFYESTETVFAYIDQGKIIPASSISPQEDLVDQCLDITLDRFHIQRYPGSSHHTIQINFSVEHRVNLAKAGPDTPLTTQDILYGYVVEARDGQSAPPTGAAIFRGLHIENELQMTIATINLADRVEKRILEVLQSNVMKKGLSLLSTVNPAFPMVSELVMGATQMFLSRNKNRPIHKVPLGFLINAAPANPKLREGSYVLIQGDSSWLNLEDFFWNTEKARIEDKELHEELAFNYMIFSVKKSIS